MGTSLIGKAVDFGSKEYGFEPRVPNLMYYAPNILVANHVNLALSKNSINNKVVFTKKTLLYLKSISSLGVVNGLHIQSNNLTLKKRILFSVFFYKNTSFFYKIKQISTPSKKFYISLKALKVLTNNLKASTLLISTSKGLITHKEALRLRTGGILMFLVS